MLESVRSNKRVAQVILALLIVPFAFFGMDAYFTDGPAGAEVATVGETKISVAEFDQALREQQDRLRQSMGGEVDRAMLESEPMRRAVVDNLVNQRLLALYAAENRLSITAQELQEVINGVESFQVDGKFSLERYEAAVRAQGMSPAVFESRLAQDLRIQQVAQAVGDSAFVSKASAQRFLAAQLEERTVSALAFPVSRYVGEVKLAEDAAQKFYDANGARFEQPARVQAEYVVFNQDVVAERVAVSDDEARKFYETNKERYAQPEERQARHILITADESASAEEKAKAREKADGLLKQLRENPARFEELAKAESQDPGSASQGGDLGYFGRGAMVKPFEDAVFGLEKGQISDVVETDFGFHIIEVTGMRGGETRAFADVKADIVEELKLQQANKLFAEQVEVFANTVYEQPDSLQPVADALKLDVKTTDWITREGGSVGEFTNAKLLDALFSEDATKKGHNVEAVEVERGTMVSARVKAFEPAKRLPFEQVKDAIEKQLREEGAATLASERAAAAIAALGKGETPSDLPGSWSAAQTLQRGKPTLPGAAMTAVFSAPTAKLPAYVGAAGMSGDYTIYRIESVNRPAVGRDDPRVAALAGQYQRLIAERDFNGFLAALRERYGVIVNMAAVRPQE